MLISPDPGSAKDTQEQAKIVARVRSQQGQKWFILRNTRSDVYFASDALIYEDYEAIAAYVYGVAVGWEQSEEVKHSELATKIVTGIYSHVKLQRRCVCEDCQRAMIDVVKLLLQHPDLEWPE